MLAVAEGGVEGKSASETRHVLQAEDPTWQLVSAGLVVVKILIETMNGVVLPSLIAATITKLHSI